MPLLVHKLNIHSLYFLSFKLANMYHPHNHLILLARPTFYLDKNDKMCMMTNNASLQQLQDKGPCSVSMNHSYS